MFALLTAKSRMKLKPDQIQMSEVSPFIGGNGKLMTDDVIEELFRNRTWKYTVLVFSLMVNWFAGIPIVFITSFAGFLQYFSFPITIFSLSNSTVVHFMHAPQMINFESATILDRIHSLFRVVSSLSRYKMLLSVVSVIKTATVTVLH